MSIVGDLVQDIEGVTPRVVAELNKVDYTIEFMRDDVENLYTVEDLDEAYKLVMANQVTGNQFKQIIGRTDYNAQTLIFDDIIVFLFHSDNYEAVFASFDFDENFPATDIVKTVAEQLGDIEVGQRADT